MPIVTQELIEECLNVCRIEIVREFAEDNLRDQSLHMDAMATLDPLVWKIVAPFIASLSAAVSAAAINARRVKEQDVQGLKEMIQERMGQKIRFDPARVEECVLLIEEILKPFDVDRDKARCPRPTSRSGLRTDLASATCDIAARRDPAARPAAL